MIGTYMQVFSSSSIGIPTLAMLIVNVSTQIVYLTSTHISLFNINIIIIIII